MLAYDHSVVLDMLIESGAEHIYVEHSLVSEAERKKICSSVM